MQVFVLHVWTSFGKKRDLKKQNRNIISNKQLDCLSDPSKTFSAAQSSKTNILEACWSFNRDVGISLVSSQH